MEILIIGGVVVLIMVFISTQIKKSAAQAFDRETIETKDFTLVKPEGFINPLREDSEYAFEAYSKEFGDKGERNIWRAQVYLTISTEADFASICQKAEQEAEKILSRKSSEKTSGDEEFCLIESEKTEDEVRFYELRKIIKNYSSPNVYAFRAMILKEFREEFASRIEELFDSFRLK